MSITWRLYRDNGLVQLFQFAAIAKIAPYLAAHRDPFLAHNRDNQPVDCLPAGRQAPGNASPASWLHAKIACKAIS